MLNPNTILYFIYEDEDEDEDGSGCLRVKIDRERERIMGNGSRARGVVMKTLLLIGGALLLKRLTKSTTRWDHTRLVAQSLTGQKVPHPPSLLFSSNSLYPFFSIFLICISVCLFISFQGTKHPEILIITSISGHSFANNNLNKLIIHLS